MEHNLRPSRFRRLAVPLLATWALFTLLMSGGVRAQSNNPVGNASLRLVWIDFLPCAALRNVSKLWNGGTVQVDCVPFDSWHPTVFNDFKSASPKYDLVFIDSQWIGEAVYAYGASKPFIVNLTDVLNSPTTRKSDFVDAALTSYSIYPPGSSDYWGLPFNSNIQVVMYRKSIFQQLNIATPGTIEEMVAAMDVINRSGLIQYPFTMVLCGSPSLPNCHDQTAALYNNFAWMFGGQLWDETTYRFKGILDAPENVAALDYFRDIFVNFTSRDPNIGSGGAFVEFCSGRSAMLLNWFSGIGTPEGFQASCSVASDVGFFAVPRLGSTGLHVLQIGGVGIHVSSFSRNIPAAIDFASFITSRAIQKIFSANGGYSVRKSVLAEPDFLFSNTGQCTSYRYVFLQSYPLGKDYWNIPEAQQLIALTRTALTQVLIGNQSSQEALSSLAATQEAIVLALHPCGPVCPTPSSSSSLSTVSILIIAFVCGIFVAVALIVFILVLYRRKHVYPFPKADQWTIPPACITTVRRLGEGAFGVVYLARYERESASHCINKLVAAKLLRQYPTREERRMFISEADTFKQACSIGHPNIVQLTGTCLQGDPMMIVMEYMGNGDVKTWLSQQKQNGVIPAREVLLRMAHEAAAGMVHLAKLKIIHCDLAARNCMLDDDLVLKIADWGQAHKLHYQDIYRMSKDAKERVLPIRWMAPEALLECEFSTNTDVWSFGVLLWEIFSHGAMPYHAMTNKEVFDEIVKGYRMGRPRDCPAEVYQLMLACWGPLRPTFLEIEATLAAIRDPSLPCPPLTQLSVVQDSPNAAVGLIAPHPYHIAVSTADESAAVNTRVDESAGGNDSKASLTGMSPLTTPRDAPATPGHITWLLSPTALGSTPTSLATNSLLCDHDLDDTITTKGPGSHVVLPMPSGSIETSL